MRFRLDNSHRFSPTRRHARQQPLSQAKSRLLLQAEQRFRFPPSNGGWTETVIKAFSGGSDGQYPVSALILDDAGNLHNVDVVLTLGLTPSWASARPGEPSAYKQPKWKDAEEGDSIAVLPPHPPPLFGRQKPTENRHTGWYIELGHFTNKESHPS
jgi:hypothetical protein